MTPAQWLRRGAVTLAGLVLLVGSASQASAAPAPAEKIVKVPLQFSGPAQKPDLGLKIESTGPRAAVETPPPSCDITDVGFNGEATYLEGVLATVELYFYGDVSCPPAAAGQTMYRLFDQVYLFKTPTRVETGTPNSCMHVLPSDPQCFYAFSTGHYICAGVQCAGIYQAIHFPQLILPIGWGWSSHDPVSCALTTPRELNCSTPSGTALVTPTI